MKSEFGAVIPTGLPEDLIFAEILPRLHAKPLFRLKCVSKGFNSVVSDDPNFKRRYMQRAYSSPESSSSSGLLSTFLFPCIIPLPEGKDPELHHADAGHLGLPINVSVISLPLPYGTCFHTITASSNGLILSRFGLQFSLCVSNPLTKQSVRLPDPTTPKGVFFGVGITTRGWSSYRVVIIPRIGDSNISRRSLPGRKCVSVTVQIFSSDTGRWASWQLDCPVVILDFGMQHQPCAYKGILHWLDRREGTVITYDPYESPHRFTRFPLPHSQHERYGSLIYSGDDEMLKYFEIEDGVDRSTLWLWRLLDSSEWGLEGKFRVPSLLHECGHVLVAPYRWSRDLIFDAFDNFTVINTRTGTAKCIKDLPEDIDQGSGFGGVKITNYIPTSPLIHVEMSPWPSPFYSQSHHN